MLPNVDNCPVKKVTQVDKSKNSKMEEYYSTINKRIMKIKENLIFGPTIVDGPSYHRLNKMLADLYFLKKEDLKAIYHLSEAFAATLRLQTILNYDIKGVVIKVQDTFVEKTNYSHGIEKEYIQFDGDLAKQEEKGLLKRLKEMPAEWSVVMVSKHQDKEDPIKVASRAKDAVPTPSSIHITQLSCGASLKDREMVSVRIAPPEVTHGMPTIFDLLKLATKEQLNSKDRDVQDILADRKAACDNLKDVVKALSDKYLREWKCLLLGRLCSNDRESQVTSCVDNVIAKHPSAKLDKQMRQLLYCITSAAVYLTDAEIESGVCCVVDTVELAIDLVNAIQAFKNDLSLLLVASRHPVILILDEELDPLPWEMMDILKRHPVSRIPSIHFLHGLYHMHKDKIVKGCKLVEKHEFGFYIINPEKDLQETESIMLKFLKERIPSWTGVQGKVPTTEDFTSALTKNNIFLYCGHSNGSHLYDQNDIKKRRVVALPLLFGCSSVAMRNLGGRAHPTGISDKFFMSGCPCMIGTLWTVLSDDTDWMTITLLNSWLPGKPIDLTGYRPRAELPFCNNEPELLRLLKHVRQAAVKYSNSAALVARGIPVRMVDSSDNSN